MNFANNISEYIVQWIIDLYQTFVNDVIELVQYAAISPTTWHDGVIWNAVTAFNDNIVLPIAYSIMTMFLLLELADIIKKQSSNGMETIHLCFLVILKICIAKLLMENMDVIIGAIFEISTQLVTSSLVYFNANDMATFSGLDSSLLSDALSDCNVLSLIGYYITGILLSLANNFCFFISKALILIRFVQVYLFTAVCAIPFATFPSEEHSVIGKSFIKAMCALGLQVVFIIIVLFMYTVMISSDVFNVTANNPLGALGELFVYCLLLVIALFQTGSWAKEITGAR